MTSLSDYSASHERNALEELREALEYARGTQQPVEELRRRGMLSQGIELARVALKSSVPHTRAAACMALEYIDDKSTLEDLRPLIDDPDDIVAMRAADALRVFGEPAATLVPRLIAVLNSSEDDLPLGNARIQPPCMFLDMPEARFHAARILGHLANDASSARSALKTALDSSSGLVRAQAARVLSRLSEPANTYLPPLREALRDRNGQSSRERVAAADMLLELGEPVVEVVPILAELVGAKDWSAIHHATQILGNLGSTASEALPALRRASQSEDRNIAQAAIDAMRKIGDNEPSEGLTIA
jgi:HEAT repeat protein